MRLLKVKLLTRFIDFHLFLLSRRKNFNQSIDKIVSDSSRFNVDLKSGFEFRVKILMMRKILIKET